MRNYKILVIILLTISITMTISISYAQISEQIPSPKQQIDNGVAPHDVVCRDDLILVDHGMNNITCVKKTTAQKMNWEIIDNKLDEKSNIVKNNEMDCYNNLQSHLSSHITLKYCYNNLQSHQT